MAERLKLSRASYQGKVTVSTNKMVDLITTARSEEHKTSIISTARALKLRYDAYAIAHEKYLNEIGDDFVGEAIAQQGEVEDAYLTAQATAESLLAEYGLSINADGVVQQISTPIQVPPAQQQRQEVVPAQVQPANQQVAGAAANQPDANAAAIQQRHEPVRPRIKLPEIKLAKFEGDQDEWLGWWNTFRTSIHEQDMEPTAKFAYLQTLLAGSAKLYISCLPPTAANYDIVIERLRTDFDRTDGAAQHHIAELMKLASVTKTTDLAGLKQLYLRLVNHTDALRALNYSNRDLCTLGAVILNKLPNFYQRKWYEDPTNDATNFDQVVRFITTEICGGRKKCNVAILY